MSEGFSGVFRGIRPVDWVLAGALTALGVWLMVENIQSRRRRGRAARSPTAPWSTR